MSPRALHRGSIPARNRRTAPAACPYCGALSGDPEQRPKRWSCGSYESADGACYRQGSLCALGLQTGTRPWEKKVTGITGLTFLEADDPPQVPAIEKALAQPAQVRHGVLAPTKSEL